MKKRYKCIFGNPPYSAKTGDSKTAKVDLWPKFSESSMEMADEVYYLTPLIWNGRHKDFMRQLSHKCGKVEIDTGKHFSVAMAICYWHTHKKDKMNISYGDYKIEVDKMTDIKYIPYNIYETLSIHQKGWSKAPVKVNRFGYDMLFAKYDGNMKKQKDDEFKHPVFSTNAHNLYWANDKGREKYKEYYGIPKIIIGRSRDNTPLFDRQGEYATTHMTYSITGQYDELVIRHKQLQSKFAKFWYETARQEMGKSVAGLIYHGGIKCFPDIPLSITDDDAIYEWLGLTDDEIKVVEKYATKVDEINIRRENKNKSTQMA